MAKKESLRTVLSNIGVGSVGVYTVNGQTVMAIHCDSPTDRENAKAIVMLYDSELKIIL